MAISESKKFQECMAERVFRSVCKRDPVDFDQTMLKSVATEFATAHNYDLRFLFSKIVTTKECLGVP